jgi:dihydrolipoamide dehydrogenase
LEQLYDVVVIGGGPGGYEAAIRASQLDMKAALIEKRHVGGTCLNAGCIPTKALLHAAEIYEGIKASAALGIAVDGVRVDTKKVYERKNAVVARLRQGVEYLLSNNKVDLYRGEGSFMDSHTLAIAGSGAAVVKGKNVIVATGSEVAVPPIPGADGPLVWTSDDILDLDEWPASLVIIGGGVIGVEFANIFNDFGVPVTILELAEQLLPGIDPEISASLRRLLTRRGVAVYTQARVQAIRGENVKQCSFEYQGQVREIEAGAVLIAAGRRPHTTNLNLDRIGVKSEGGFITVDRRMKTGVNGVYAIGDVIGGIQLAHVASAEGFCAIDSITGRQCRINFDIVPSCIYTRPEIACVGLTGQQAAERGRRVKVGRFPLMANGKAVIMEETAGLVKLVSDERTGEILGAQIMAPRATDMIGEIVAAMNAESTIEELGLAIHPHPTLCEAIMEAAHDVEGLSINKPR